MTTRSPAAFLLVLAASTAAAQPFDGGARSFDGGLALSARLSVDDNAIPHPLSGGSGVAVAVSGAQGLVVWKDNRDYRDMLYASRLDAQGQMLDPGGVRLIKSLSQRWGLVAFGQNYLLFTPRTSFPYSLLAYRVSSQGELLDSTPTEVVSNMGLDYPVGAACTPQVCLFAWTGFSGLMFARLSSQGAALEPNGVTLTTASAPNGSTETFVATDGTDFLVTTHLSYFPDGGTVPAGVLTARVVASTGQATLGGVPLGSGYPANLSGSPFGYLLGGKTSFDGPFVLARLTPQGALLDATPISIPNASSDDRAELVFSGNAYWAVWRESPATGSLFKAVSIPPTGVVGALPEKTLFSSTTRSSLYAAASAPFGFWLAIAHGTPVATEAMPTVNRFDATGAPRDGNGIPFRVLPSVQQRPSVAWGGQSYLAVWEDNADNFYRRQVYARRFDALGQPLDAAAFRLVASSTPQREPKVAFDGQNFMVVWTEGPFGDQSIRAARVSPSGTVLDPQGFRVSPMAVNAVGGTVAAAVGVTGVLWQKVTGSHIEFQRVSAAGQVVDVAPIDVRIGPATQGAPALFSNGTSFLALWLDSALSSGQVYGARITTAGVVQDLPPINVSARPGGSNDGDYGPSAAFGARQWLVVYNARTSQQVASRVSPTGQVLEALRPLAFPGAADYSPSVTAFDGQRFRYLWAMNTWPDAVRFGSWDTSSDAGPPSAELWRERVDALAWAQRTNDSALLLTEAPHLQDLPFLPRLSRRLVQFCEPGVPCAAPSLQVDAGVVDAGVVDAGVVDAGVVDAGVADAGVIDAGAPEADAGLSSDSGVAFVDGGSSPEAEPDDAEVKGCGCGSSGGATEAIASLLFLGLLRRRRSVVS